jgi:hypothetical protein
MNDETRFSELYSRIEETAPLIESKPKIKKQFDKDIEEYKELLKKRYEASMEDESEEGSFYYYNGCHGYLELDCDPYVDIPTPIKDYILKENKPVIFIIHKKTHVFAKVSVGIFTETASLAFQVDKDQYRKYLKLEYKLNEDTGEVELTIYVYNNLSRPIEITEKEGIPNIRLEYHNKDFNMGYFPLLHGPNDSIFYVSKYKFTEGGFFQGSYVFPKLVADFEYTEKDKRGSFFSSSLFSMEESLLERCFKDLYEYYEDKEREEEFHDEEIEEIEIDIFNSSCLYSNDDVRKEIRDRYKQWSEIMAHEIEISLIDSPLKRRKKAGSKKKKRKTKRSHKKKKRKNKRTHKKKRRTKKK